MTRVCVFVSYAFFVIFFSKPKFQNLFAFYYLFSKIEKESVEWGGWEKGKIWEELGVGKY